MIDILVFLLLGVIAGVVMGLIPGVHPNMIILVVPVLASLNLPVLPLLAFLVSMGVTNAIVDFIPSILLGAPDAEKELSVLPGHKMLLAGHGYEAVKLAVTGALGSVIFVALALPVLFLVVPAAFSFFSPVITLLLGLIVTVMILTEKGRKKSYAAAAFLAAGYIGVSMNRLSIENTLLLFPIFSGFFGVSVLLIQMKTRARIPKQKRVDIHMSRKTINRSVVFGSIGGVVSGVLPGVGSSEIASLATVDKNDRSFLMTLGALTMANTVLSILSLWLISRPRSGLAVAIDQLVAIGFGEVLFIVFVAVFSVGVASLITLKATKRFLSAAEKIDYSFVSYLVVVFIVFMTLLFTGPTGLLLLITCTAVGLITNYLSIKRGILMGVLILPTMLFYAGF